MSNQAYNIKSDQQQDLKDSQQQQQQNQNEQTNQSNTQQIYNQDNQNFQNNNQKTNDFKKKKQKDLKDPDLSQITLDKALKVNQTQIDFGNVFPGQILEETIIILNNMNETKVHFKIQINCLTKEFDDLDEYVYSMRRPTQNDAYNYNDTFLILLSKKAISYYKLAIKVPNYREEKEIIGSVVISSEMTQKGDIVIPLKSNIIIPKIVCEKMMKLKRLKFPVIKLFLKNTNKNEFRIALKNKSQHNCIGQLSVYRNPKEKEIFQVSFHPPQISMQANLPNNFVMSIKSNINDEEKILNKEFRLVLLLSIRHSSLIYSYPVLLGVGNEKA